MIAKIASFTLARIVSAISTFLLVVLIARGLGSDDLASYGFATALIAPFITLSKLSLKTVVSTTYKLSSRVLAEFLVARTVVQLSLGVLLVVGALSYSGPAGAILISLLITLRIVESYSEMSHGVAQRYGKTHAVTWSLYVHAGMMLLSAALWIALGGGLAGMLVVVLLAKISGFAFLDASWLSSSLSKAKGMLSPPSSSIIEITRLTIISFWALGVAPFVSAIFVNLPRYAAQVASSTDELAAVVSASYFLMAFNLLSTSIGQVYLPRIRKIALRGEAVVVGRVVLIGFFAAAGCAGLLGALPFGIYDQAMSLVFGQEFSERGNVLRMYTMAGCLMVFENVLFYMRVAFQARISQLLIYIAGIMAFCISWVFITDPSDAASIVLSWMVGVSTVVLLSAVFVLRDIKYLARQS